MFEPQIVIGGQAINAYHPLTTGKKRFGNMHTNETRSTSE
jgi:hypothetical protein